MKFNQLILFIFAINLLNVLVGFTINTSDISTLESSVTTWFSSDSGLYNLLTSVEEKVRDSDNWFVKVVAEILQGISQAINLIRMTAQVIFIILWGWLTPFISMTSILAEPNGITFFKFIAIISFLIFQWFNLMLIIKLINFIKGADS